ncbi:MAG: hypothetical protein EPO00_02155, partial [Chloroflexota bacterium]
LALHLPPGGKDRLDHLAIVMSERPGFFEAAFSIHEYADGIAFRIGDMTVRPHPIGHYVPAWSMEITGPGGERVIYAGDMGPAESVVGLARGAELLILEATLHTDEFDDLKRGHLTAEEAVDHAVRAGVPRAVLVHYPIERLEAIRAICAPTDGRVQPALSRMEIEVAAGGTPVITMPERRS